MSQTYENDDVARFFHYPAKVDFCTSPSFGWGCVSLSAIAILLVEEDEFIATDMTFKRCLLVRTQEFLSGISVNAKQESATAKVFWDMT